MENLDFYRAIGVPEYNNYKSCSFIFKEREWVELELESEGGFEFQNIKKIVDVGGWKAEVNHSVDLPRDVIIRVSGIPGREFVPRRWHVPARYINIVNIDFDRAVIVYDPRAVLSASPIHLSEELIPQLSEFKGIR